MSNAEKFIKRHILSFKIDEGLPSASAFEEEWPRPADGRSLKHLSLFRVTFVFSCVKEVTSIDEEYVGPLGGGKHNDIPRHDVAGCCAEQVVQCCIRRALFKIGFPPDTFRSLMHQICVFWVSMESELLIFRIPISSTLLRWFLLRLM